jgi:hypothetical protein
LVLNLLIETGPGPAAYSVPTTLGVNAAPTKGTKSPAFSLGARLKPLKTVETPAPNVFNTSSKTRHGINKPPAASLKGGFKKKTKDGKDIILVSHDAGKWGCFVCAIVFVWHLFENNLFFLAADLSTPGPLEYSVKPTAGLSKAPAYTLSPRKFYEKKVQTPSPAQCTFFMNE